MRLISSLLEGKRPDLVIFYSGANEVIRPFLYGEPGIFLFSEFDNYLMQKDLSPVKRISLLIMETIRDRSMIYKGLEKAIHVFTKPERRKNVADTFTSQQLENLAEQIAENYRRSMQLLDNLSATYGFDYVTILQPVIFTKPVLSAEEKSIDSWTQNPKLKNLYLETYKKIDALHLANYVNLANVFDAHEETIYMDFCHISEEGNAIVAEAMLQRIENYFEKGNPVISQSDERKNENNMGNLLTKRRDTFQIR